MVEIRFGNKVVACLRLFDGGIMLCKPDGLRIMREMTYPDYRSALYRIAEIRKIADMWVHQTDDLDYSYPVDGSDRLLYAPPPTSGLVTLEEEADWAIFHLGSMVYDATTERLYEVTISELLKEDHPRYTPVPREAWSEPKFPDEYYHQFVDEVQKKFPKVGLVKMSRIGHHQVVELQREMCQTRYPQVRISYSGERRVVELLGETTVSWLSLNDDKFKLRERTQAIGSIMEAVRLRSWDSLFPKDWDVVEVSKEDFYERTFAGHCFQRENFVGLKSRPRGYDVAWENSHDTALLIRVSKHNTVRCPPEFKGRVIGQKGGNIKTVAKNMGLEHWQLKLI